MSDRESEGHASTSTALAITPAARLAQIKTRRLDIQATLLEWKRAYFLDGVARSIEQRIELQAEDARLALEANTLKAEAYRAEGERLAKLPIRAELLAALKSAVAYADAMHRAQVWQDSQQHVDYVTFPEWRAVIAKAERAKP